MQTKVRHKKEQEMTTKTTDINGNDLLRFDLRDPVEKNFNRYQDAIASYPDSAQHMKLRYDQYLKTVPLYNRDQSIEEETRIEFPVAE
jgi:hypothetical protein